MRNRSSFNVKTQFREEPEFSSRRIRRVMSRIPILPSRSFSRMLSARFTHLLFDESV